MLEQHNSDGQNPTLQSPESLQPFQEDDFLPPISRWMSGGAMALIGVMAGMVGLAAIIEYNVTVQAPASVRPAGDLSVVQAPPGVTIGRILIQEGQSVRKGDVIAEIGVPDQNRLLALRTQRSNVQQYIDQYQDQINQIDTQLAQLNTKIMSRAGTPTPPPGGQAGSLTEADIMTALAKINQTASPEAQQLAQERDRLLIQRRSLVAQINLDQATLQKVNADLSQLAIQSPVDGTVLRLGSNASGQAARSTDVLAQIVPRNVPLVVKARVNTQDISQVAVGQTSQLRITAYPYPDYGTLTGTVQAIAPDVVTTGENNSEPIASYYEVTIQPDRPYLGTADRPFPIQPGMEVRADIISHRETILRSLLRKMRLWSDL
ncbi:HlyD family efflux transporter periplasmic adaptor subunit [Leptodesmis sp.]|uniref:HlyD family efflux transporter periplasmic adaptor subunit n=1 Tax=Leptodesmis sp. TaxID=3100501 RepID=UPI0040534F78